MQRRHPGPIGVAAPFKSRPRAAANPSASDASSPKTMVKRATTPLAERPALCEGGIMRQAALVQGRWKLVERSLADESTDPVLLSNPELTREWVAAARERYSDDLELFAWLADKELESMLFDERLRTGLTEELYRRLRARPAYTSLIRCLRRANRSVRPAGGTDLSSPRVRRSSGCSLRGDQTFRRSERAEEVAGLSLIAEALGEFGPTGPDPAAAFRLPRQHAGDGSGDRVG